MESSFTALCRAESNTNASLSARNSSAEEAAAVAGEEEEERDDEEAEEGEQGQDADEEEEDYENGSDGPREQVPNNDMEEPTGIVAANPPSLAQQPAHRCAKRSRASTAKERISKMPPCAAGKRSSIYRGVTRHRWTGRYEAHLWDKSTWNQTQNKKGKQATHKLDYQDCMHCGHHCHKLGYQDCMHCGHHCIRNRHIISSCCGSTAYPARCDWGWGTAGIHSGPEVYCPPSASKVYLGAYDDEEAAARAYDLAALKYWGPGTLINFPVSDYARDIDEMLSFSREDYLASLRRKSSGFSRVAKMKGASRNHPNARWDVQAGGSFASTLPTIGGYDILRDGGGRPPLEFGVLGCPPAGMMNLCHFLNWLQPRNLSGEPQSIVFKKSSRSMEEDRLSEEHSSQRSSTWGSQESPDGTNEQDERYRGDKPPQCFEPYRLPSLGLHNRESKSGISALSSLSRSSLFAKMEQGLDVTRRPKTAERNCENATMALSAALAMDDFVQSEEVERTRSLYPSNCLADVHPSSLTPEGVVAALRKDDCVQSSQEVESSFCLTDRSNGHADANGHFTSIRAETQIASCSDAYSRDYVHAQSLLALPLPPPISFIMDQAAYFSDHMPSLWSTFEPASSMSMGMIF